MEKWKAISGYEGSYEVSDYGRVRSLDRIGSNGAKLRGKLIKFKITRYGYCELGLYKDRRRETVRVNRLVAMAFIPNPENKPQVNHKNGDKTFNFKTNLEWMTCQENIDHAIKFGLRDTKGEGNGRAKLAISEVKQIRKSTLSAKKLSIKFNISLSQLYDIKNYKRWKI